MCVDITDTFKDSVERYVRGHVYRYVCGRSRRQPSLQLPVGISTDMCIGMCNRMRRACVQMWCFCTLQTWTFTGLRMGMRAGMRAGMCVDTCGAPLIGTKALDDESMTPELICA